MTIAQAIAGLPDETRVSVTIGGEGVTIGELRSALAAAGPAMISTEQAAEKYGRRPDYWRGIARGMVGAVKGRTWLLPVAECEAHLAGLARARRTPRAWTERASAHAPSARPSGLQAR